MAHDGRNECLVGHAINWELHMTERSYPYIWPFKSLDGNDVEGVLTIYEHFLDIAVVDGWGHNEGVSP